MVAKAKQVWIRQMDAARQAQIAVVVEILGELGYFRHEAAELDPALVAECIVRNVDFDGVIRDLDEAHESTTVTGTADTGKGGSDSVERIDVEKIPDCPRCGGEMTVRVVRNGPRAGARFFGCLAYPACRGTAQIEQ
jgi:hypothetical protein